MKKLLLSFLALALLLTLVSQPLAAKDKIRLGVLRFTNQTAAGWWSGSVASDLQDMLASELVSTKAFSVLERKEIDAVLGEQDLSASGRVSNKTKVQMKKLKGAQYLVAATVSAYEENTSGKKGGVRFKGLSVGGGKDKAYIAVDLKVINTETGEITDARTIEASAKGSALGAGLSLRNFSVGGESYKKTPTGKAIRACILYIAEYLECSMVKGEDAGCMDKFNEMDEKRKKKTKDSIDLD
ncbi:MAG: CsgG/HfaB family protein [Acidobacteria bacterium]|jgi:curli biogenesis system outer membrane secretion channel CsgG|nr:CsgG/HfaB family protein [Acidobacteriota bacterium]